MRDMEGRVAIVTGAAGGIGRATAVLFAKRGAKVVTADIKAEGGLQTVGIIRQQKGQGFFVAADMTEAAQIENVVKRTVETYGRLDYACNNAGVPGLRRPLTELPEETWDEVIDTNLKGMWLCMKYEIPEMLKQGRGAIVNISSVAGLRPSGSAAPYASSKHGIIGLTKLAALEQAEAGIRVNVVCPGVVRTPMFEEVCKKYPEREAWYMATTPMKRIAVPEEIAEAVVWLCSDAASFVTGVALPVDGGTSV